MTASRCPAEHGDCPQRSFLLHGYSDSWRSYRLMMASYADGLRHAVTVRTRRFVEAGRRLQPCHFRTDVVCVMDALR